MEKLGMEERHWRIDSSLAYSKFLRERGEERRIRVLLGFWSSISGGSIFLWSSWCVAAGGAFSWSFWRGSTIPSSLAPLLLRCPPGSYGFPHCCRACGLLTRVWAASSSPYAPSPSFTGPPVAPRGSQRLRDPSHGHPHVLSLQLEWLPCFEGGWWMEKLGMEERHWRIDSSLAYSKFLRERGEERSIGVLLGFWSSISGGANFPWSSWCVAAGGAFSWSFGEGAPFLHHWLPCSSVVLRGPVGSLIAAGRVGSFQEFGRPHPSPTPLLHRSWVLPLLLVAHRGRMTPLPFHLVLRSHEDHKTPSRGAKPLKRA
eukprot:Gb_04664 [translate_table: standard]